MKISVKRTGGFAGASEDVAATDTAELDSAAARRLEQMVQGMRFFDLPARVGTSVGGDLFHYEVTVTDRDRQHTVSFAEDDEAADTVGVRQLVATLRTAT